MRDIPPWTDNEVALLSARMLLLMYNGVTTVAEIAESLEANHEQVGERLAMMQLTGWVSEAPQRLGERYPHAGMLTLRGRAEVELRAERRTPRNLTRACEAALLTWLDIHEGETIDSSDSFESDVRAYFFGEPFSAATRWQAARELHDRGLIKGGPSWGGPVLRPAITSLGRGVVSRYNGDVGEWLAATSAGGGDSITINHSVGVNVASRSPGAAQDVQVSGEARDKVLNLAAALEQMMPVLGLAPADNARASGLVGQLRAAADEGEPGKVARLLDAVRTVAVSGTGSAAGQGIVALVEAIAPHLHL